MYYDNANGNTYYRTQSKGDEMKLKLIIDKTRDEEILIYAHEKTALIESIEQLVLQDNFELVGYIDREAVKLNLAEICRFTVEDNKVFAETLSEQYRLKYRLWQLEENLPDGYVKINQSCIANVRMIDRFDTSISGSMLVKFKNGSTDYVSRRQLKTVKERLGL